MRPRGKDKHLPPCVFYRHGAYWYVKRGKWTRLGSNLTAALAEYARIITPPSGGCDELLDRTLERYAEKVRAKKIAENTLKQYGFACKQLKKNLAEFTPAQVKAHHVAGLMDLDRDKPNMANRKLSFLRQAFSYALTWGMAETNPTYGVARHEEAKRGRLISDEEFKLVQAQACMYLQVMMDLAFCTGQRIMDVVRIKLADVSADGIYFEAQKTKKKILVRMNPGMRDAIDRAKKLHTNVRGLTLFHQRGGKPYSYGAVRDALQRACKLAGVVDYKPNDHRAMSLSATDKQGKDAQGLGQHTTRAMTERYIRHRETKVVDGPSFGQPLDNWTEEDKESKA